GERLLVDEPLPLFDRDNPVDADRSHLVDDAARPSDLDEVDLRALLEPEVKPKVALRDVAVAAAHLVDERRVARDDAHARADAVAVALDPDRLDDYRVVRIAAVVAEELRRAVEVVDDHVDVAVGVEVPEGGTPADARFAER